MKRKTWLQKLKLLGKKEDGQAMVLFALFLVVVLGFAALVVDVGLMTHSRSKLQHAADAGALAAAMELPPIKKDGTANDDLVDYAAIDKAGRDYAVKNLALDEVVVEPIKNAQGYPIQVRVTVSEPVNHAFARIFGMDTTTIQATAVAGRYAVASGNAPPIVNVNVDYGTGGSIVLRDKADKSTSDRDWLNIGEYMKLQDGNQMEIEEVTFDPLAGLIVDKGGIQANMDYLRDLLAYGGPYYAFSLNRVIIDDLNFGEDDKPSYGVALVGGETAFLKKTTSKKPPTYGDLTPLDNKVRIAPFAKLVDDASLGHQRYVECPAGTPGAVEQIVLLRLESVGVPATGNGDVTADVVGIHSIYDSLDEYEPVIGHVKSRLLE